MGVVINMYSGEKKNSTRRHICSEWSKVPESAPNFAVTSNMHGNSIYDHLIPDYTNVSTNVDLLMHLDSHLMSIAGHKFLFNPYIRI